MGVTANGIWYPDPGSPPQGQIQMQQLAQSVEDNVASKIDQTAKSIVLTQQTRTHSDFGLMPTPDQVSITLPQDGLIQVWYMALWARSLGDSTYQSGYGQASIYLNDESVYAHHSGGNNSFTNVAQIDSTYVEPNHFHVLATTTGGLVSAESESQNYIGIGGNFPTTGTIVGLGGGKTYLGPSGTAEGGPVSIFAAAGDYNVSIRFRGSDSYTQGNHAVHVKQRRLWVRVLKF